MNGTFLHCKKCVTRSTGGSRRADPRRSKDPSHAFSDYRAFFSSQDDRVLVVHFIVSIFRIVDQLTALIARGSDAVARSTP